MAGRTNIFSVYYFLVTAVIFLSTICTVSAQVAVDNSYNPKIPEPAYDERKGPVVAVDKAHDNYHTADQRYKPFASLLKRDGYRVIHNEKLFSLEALKELDVLVIANPLSIQNREIGSLQTPSALSSAFTEEEITSVRTWVENGGSLFLIADHTPFASAVKDLAKAFGFEFTDGFAMAGHWVTGRPNAFDLKRGLEKCAVTVGRSKKELVKKVVIFAGSAFKAPNEAIPVLVFGKNSLSCASRQALQMKNKALTVPIDGWYQGAILTAGKGRVAVFGEAAMFTAQIARQYNHKAGMNAQSAKQNHQLLLNVMHWLTRVEGMPEK
jgi:hypothetical protein